ncbi:MAG: nitrite reductase (NADH) small subunit [Phenylobacterium sp.]|jgi:nitrite reductase (NADH) small subunit
MKNWTDICYLDDIPKMGAVCALHEGKQVAIFNLSHQNGQFKNCVKSMCNVDPFADASVLSRGIISDIEGRQVVASPLNKLHFCLDTGQCLQHPDTSVSVFPVRVRDNKVQLQVCS